MFDNSMVRCRTAQQSLARRVARAAGTFELERMGRDPASVTIVSGDDWMVVNMLTSLSPLDRLVAASGDGRGREIERRHRASFYGSLSDMRSYVRRLAGVELLGGMTSIDVATGSIVKTFTTYPTVELFLMGQGLPMFGVPIDAHVHADGLHAPGTEGTDAFGTICLHRREPVSMPTR